MNTVDVVTLRKKGYHTQLKMIQLRSIVTMQQRAIMTVLQQSQRQSILM